MAVAVPLIIAFLILLILIRLSVLLSDKIKFFLIGQDNGFKLNEIILFWKLASETKLNEPESLYFSVPSLNHAIKTVIDEARRTGTLDSDKVQDFLSRLYKFRTKINLEHENKKGIESTRFLEKGQKLRIILPGKGVFASEILNNGHEIVIKLPTKNNVTYLEGSEWEGKKISVYLWRKKDASYVFDTTVAASGIYNSLNVLYISHTANLLRVQKRKSVRCACSIPASLYFLTNENIDFNAIENIPGYRCIIEDISEDGALIRAGGKGVPDVQIKIQFQIAENVIVMYGIIRAVEYNSKKNQSRLHFECLHIEEDMKNAVLTFVYNILPQEEKDVLDAINGTEKDKKLAEKETDLKSEDKKESEKMFQPAGTDSSADGEYNFDEPKEVLQA